MSTDRSVRTCGASIRSVTALCAVLLAGCGVFSVRDPYSPVGSVDDDPLSFSDLLSGTSESFASPMDYDQLFEGGFVYWQGAGPTFAGTQFLSRLDLIVDQDTLVKVVWERSDQPLVLSHDSSKVFVVDSVTYTVYLSGDVVGAGDFAGYCDIGLRYVGEWVIVSFNDFPSAPAGGLSYFHPNYQAPAAKRREE